MNKAVRTPLLDCIDTPEDLRKIDEKDLSQLAKELRAETISAVSETGGHLGAGLGVVELTIALHKVFNTPHDRLIWDVGHQCYPHKILTKRRSRIRTLRQENGLSGFTKRDESVYDPFGAAHAATSISAALGILVASDLVNLKRKVIAVIGDGAMSAGMAYEAMNNAGANNAKLVVILNDNNMSIAPPVGAMSAYLARLVSCQTYLSLRQVAKQLTKRLPKFLHEKARRTEEYARGFWTGGTMFEELGFYYVGPVDGHNMNHLLPVLRNIRDANIGPIMLHVVTQKGKGYPPAEKAADKCHAVTNFNVITGKQEKKLTSNKPTYTKVFAQSLISEAQHDDKIVAITAAMPCGTGLNMFGKQFPDRMFDVGIAEQHAVTFAAGLASEGMRPFVAIYSTFLQRAYDQIVHDVSIQNLPVRFAIDRAGYVGADGPTHAGSFDIAYLTTLPKFIVMAAANEAELKHMVATAAAYDEGPIAFRYPRGEGTGVEMPKHGEILEIGKGRILFEGEHVALVCLGARLEQCLLARQELKKFGFSVSVVDARFAKPLDTNLLNIIASNHQAIITIEEGSIGGFASHVAQYLSNQDLLGEKLKLRSMVMPDCYLDQASPNKMYTDSGLDHMAIMNNVFSILGKKTDNKKI